MKRYKIKWLGTTVLFAVSCVALRAAHPLIPTDLTNPSLDIERIEIFLLMGQSNMKGRGDVPAEQVLNPRILMMHLKNDQWYLAQHPLHLIGDPMTFKGAGNEGVGPGLAFGRTIASREPRVLIGIVPCAVGGSKLELWTKGARLYENAVRRTRLALGSPSSVPVVLKGALWLQGEADANPALQPTYQERLVRMITDLRTDLAAPDLPFIVATIGDFDDTINRQINPKALLNEALIALPAVCPHTACVDARDLKENIGDRVHYSTASANTIGKRMAMKYVALKH